MRRKGEQKEEQERLLKAKKERIMMNEDSEEGYVSPEDPFPHEARRRPTKEDLDKDFDSNEEVGKKP